MLGVECKRVDAPRMTPSIRIALDDLQLERIAVVYPGTLRYQIADRVEAVPLSGIIDGMACLLPRGHGASRKHNQRTRSDVLIAPLLHEAVRCIRTTRAGTLFRS